MRLRFLWPLQQPDERTDRRTDRRHFWKNKNGSKPQNFIKFSFFSPPLLFLPPHHIALHQLLMSGAIEVRLSERVRTGEGGVLKRLKPAVVIYLLQTGTPFWSFSFPSSFISSATPHNCFCSELCWTVAHLSHILFNLLTVSICLAIMCYKCCKRQIKAFWFDADRWNICTYIMHMCIYYNILLYLYILTYLSVVAV